MSVKDWMDILQSVIASLALLGAGWLALRRWLKNWVKGVAADSREAARQLTTSNGKTVAEYIEGMDKKFNNVSELAQDSARRADAAHTLASHVSSRLDEHFLRDHEHKPLV